jgi:small subunit ribosomal protein S4
VGLLERRLDAVVYRLNLVPTIFSARQLINHGHVRVNGKRVNIRSYMCSVGDIVSIREASKDHPLVLEASQGQSRDIPDYISPNLEKLEGTFNRIPVLADIPYPVEMEPNLVVEYYSR